VPKNIVGRVKLNMVTKMQYQIRKIQPTGGMTLLEMVISVAIVAIILAVVVPQFRSIQNNWDSRRGSTEALQNARVLMDHINSSLSKAMRITTVSDSSEINGYIEFEDNDGNTCRYELSSSYVQFGAVGDLSNLAGPVSRLQFTCYDACDLDTPLPAPIDPNEIRAVQVQATVTNSAGLGQDKNVTTKAYLRTNGNVAGSTTSLVGWWKLDDSSGTTAADSSSFGNTGTLTNMAGSEWAGGVLSGALEFDGTNDYVDIANPAAANFNISGAISITAWVKLLDVHHSWNYIVRHKSKTEFGFYNDTKPRFKLKSTNHSYYEVNGNDRLTLGRWYHIAGVRDGTFMGIYVDGSLVDSRNDFSGELNSNIEYIRIGGKGSSGLNAGIDDVRIYNRALTAQEIYDMANWWKLSGQQKFEFANSKGKYPALVRIDSTHYLCAYQGSGDHGWAVVLTVDTNNWTITSETAFEFDNSRGKYPTMAQIDTTHYLCVYEGPSDDGWAVVLTVDTGNWTISKATPIEFDTSNGEHPALVQIDSTNYLCAYEGPGDHCDNGWAAILTVDPNNWTLSKRSSLRYASAGNHRDVGMNPTLARIDANHYLCAYEGQRDDGYAVVLTVDLDATPGPDPTIGWWKLDETSGTTAADSSASGNDGTLVDMSSSPWSTGIIDGALRFDGSNDRVDLGSFDVTGGTGLTIAAWFKADDFGVNDARIVSKATGTSKNSHYWMLGTKNRHGGIKLRFSLRTNGSTKELNAGSGDLSSHVWTHAAAVWNGTQMLIYKDAVLVGSTGKSGTLNTSPSVDVAIGNQPSDAGNKPFDGFIDDVRIYNRALNTEEIAALAQKFVTVATAYEYDTHNGQGPDITQIDSTHYLCAYEGSGDNGRAVLLNTDPTNWTITRASSFEFDDSKGKYPALAQINSSRYLCAYQGDHDDGWAVILAVDTDNSTISMGTPLEFDRSKGKYPALAQIDSTHYLCAYQGDHDDGWAHVLTVGTGSDPVELGSGGQILP